MLTICPSPFCPLTIAVTSTRVSLATKFRMHRSYLLEWPVCACRSNLRAEEKGRAARTRRVLAAEPMRTMLATTVESSRTEHGWDDSQSIPDCYRIEVLLKMEIWLLQRLIDIPAGLSWRAKSASPNSFHHSRSSLQQIQLANHQWVRTRAWKTMGLHQSPELDRR